MTTATLGMWERLVGQDAAVGALRHALASDHIAHAYLFAGPQGVGRLPAALALAAGVNCPDRGCGECAVCRKVLRRAHADVHVIGAEGGQIVVDQVRTIREEANRAPFEGRMKVFIVDEAERMNPAAANALLKVLEEPPLSALFVLMTDAPDDLLPTVASRCRRLDFVPLNPDAIVRVLIEHHDVEPGRATWAAEAGGNLATALRLAKDSAAEARRERHLGFPSRLRGAAAADAVRLAGEVADEAASAAEALKERQKEEIVEHAQAFGEGRGTAAARKRLETKHKREARKAEQLSYEIVLADLTAFYRGALVAATDADVAIDQQVREAVGRTPERPVTVIASALEAIEETRRALTRNANAALALEALFMRLA